jgi:hypothetical protein
MSTNIEKKNWLEPQAEAAIACASRMASAKSWAEALDASGRLLVNAGVIVGSLNSEVETADCWAEGLKDPDIREFWSARLQGVRSASLVIAAIGSARDELNCNLPRLGGLVGMAMRQRNPEAADCLALNQELNRLVSELSKASESMICKVNTALDAA